MPQSEIKPKLVVGPRNYEPTIHFELEDTASPGIAIIAKHSEDNSRQTIAEIAYDEDGFLEFRIRDLHSPHLCAAAGINKGAGISARFHSLERQHV